MTTIALADATHDTPEPPQQTHGLNGIARPAAGPDVVLTSADQAGTTLEVQSGKTYDGGGKLIEAITQANVDTKITDVVIQNYKVRGGIGIYLRGDRITVQNCDIAQVIARPDGDINGITLFGDDNVVCYNDIGWTDLLVKGKANTDFGGSHTDAFQTWATPSKGPSSRLTFHHNRINGPATSDNRFVHQAFMAEGPPSHDGGGGASGTSSDWLIADNIIDVQAVNQLIKLDGIKRVTVTRNVFRGKAARLCETGDSGTTLTFFSDNDTTGFSGSIGVPVTNGSGPAGPSPGVGRGTPALATAIDPPATLIGSVSSSRTVTLNWTNGSRGTPARYEIHEFRKHPDATLKATIDAPTTSRVSGVLQPAMLEYAVRSIDVDGTVSRFSPTVKVTITASGGTVAPGRPVGWDSDDAPIDPGDGTPLVGTAVHPMDLISGHWYLTTPEWSPVDDKKTWNIYKNGRGKPVTDKNPDLDTFVRSGNPKRAFMLNPAKTGIVMSSDSKGSHTPNSKNTRMELREMLPGGKDEAKWSTRHGRHQCEIVTQVDRLDGNHMVIGQIHGGKEVDDDLTVFRLEGSSLWITNGDTAHGHLVTGSYQVGRKITIKFDVDSSGVCTYFFNGSQVWTLQLPRDTESYFKAGAYLQRKGPADSWGQVTLYQVTVSHE
jgi:Alginate lyase